MNSVLGFKVLDSYVGDKKPNRKPVLTEDGNYFQFQLINITPI